MDKKYNGFNNGRDKSDGVGGREVNNGTQETMTKEQMVAEYLKEQFPLRKNILKDVSDGLYDSHILLMDRFAKQQLSAEREAHKKEIERILSAVARGENLANSLNFDGKSELDKERERAGKLIHALEMCLQALRVLDAKDFVAYTAGKVALIEYKQTINEYDTATKES